MQPGCLGPSKPGRDPASCPCSRRSRSFQSRVSAAGAEPPPRMLEGNGRCRAALSGERQEVREGGTDGTERVCPRAQRPGAAGGALAAPRDPPARDSAPRGSRPGRAPRPRPQDRSSARDAGVYWAPLSAPRATRSPGSPFPPGPGGARTGRDGSAAAQHPAPLGQPPRPVPASPPPHSQGRRLPSRAAAGPPGPARPLSEVR